MVPRRVSLGAGETTEIPAFRVPPGRRRDGYSSRPRPGPFQKFRPDFQLQIPARFPAPDAPTARAYGASGQIPSSRCAYGARQRRFWPDFQLQMRLRRAATPLLARYPAPDAPTARAYGASGQILRLSSGYRLPVLNSSSRCAYGASGQINPNSKGCMGSSAQGPRASRIRRAVGARRSRFKVA